MSDAKSESVHAAPPPPPASAAASSVDPPVESSNPLPRNPLVSVADVIERTKAGSVVRLLVAGIESSTSSRLVPRVAQVTGWEGKDENVFEVKWLEVVTKGVPLLGPYKQPGQAKKINIDWVIAEWPSDFLSEEPMGAKSSAPSADALNPVTSVAECVAALGAVAGLRDLPKELHRIIGQYTVVEAGDPSTVLARLRDSGVQREGAVMDQKNDRIIFGDYAAIRAYGLTSGAVTTIAGGPKNLGVPPKAASLKNMNFTLICGVTVDPTDGAIICSDHCNVIVRIDERNDSVSIIAGIPNGQSGHIDGIGTASVFYSVRGICCDSKGNVFVADVSNHRLRLLTKSAPPTTPSAPTYVVSTITGDGRPENIDGPLSSSALNCPMAVAIDGRDDSVAYVGCSGGVRRVDLSVGTSLKSFEYNPLRDICCSFDRLRFLFGVHERCTISTIAVLRLGHPMPIAVDDVNGGIYVGCPQSLLLCYIDVATGITKVLDEPNAGDGLVLDHSRGALYIFEARNCRICKVTGVIEPLTMTVSKRKR